MLGRIHSFESFGTVDGPGIRFVVFMQGCPLRCKYCHNPDTWNLSGGTQYTAEQVAQNALRYKKYWRGGGGVTVSGGEPLLQIEFVTELFGILKKEGVHCHPIDVVFQVVFLIVGPQGVLGIKFVSGHKGMELEAGTLEVIVQPGNEGH